jgi:hypothetical protein
MGGNADMKIRWKYYLRKDRSRSIRAEIVRTFWDKVMQKTRSQTVAYLTTIQEKHLNNPIKRELFWQAADRKLALLLIPVREELRLRLRLAEKVPRPGKFIPVRATHQHREGPPLESSCTSSSSSRQGEADAETPSVAELERCLAELMRRVG